jgi:O-antigen ligase
MADHHTSSVGRRDGGRSRWVDCVAVFFLLQTIGAFAFLDRLIYGDWALKSGDKFTQILNLLTIAAGLVLFGRGVRRLRSVRTGSALVLGVAVFLLLSALWSIDPLTTLRRGVLYVFFVIGTIGLASNLDGDEFMDVVGTSCFMAAAISIVLLVVSPGTAWMYDGSGLRGVLSHKNMLGEVMVAGALGTLHGIRLGGGRLIHKTLMLVTIVTVAVLAKSGTAIMMIFILCLMNAVVMMYQRGGSLRILSMVLIVLGTPVGTIAALFPDLLLEMIGKDPTLTGRTDLWAYVIYYINQKPLLGWGLTAFWSPTNPFADEISGILGWTVPEAHNGILELLLEVGAVGTALFLVLYGRNVLLALRCLRTPARELGVSSLLCYLWLLMAGVTEQVLVDPSQASTGIFFVTGLICERMLRAAGQRDVAAVRWAHAVPDHASWRGG